jgi:hypothetical protein
VSSVDRDPERAIGELLDARAATSTICPSTAQGPIRIRRAR